MTISAVAVDIWNRALGEIGETQQVEDIEEPTPAAAACRLVYDDLVLKVLESGYWPFAIQECDLIESSSQSQIFAYADVPSPYDTFQIPFPFKQSSQVAVTHIDSSGTETELTTSDYTITAANPAQGIQPSVALDTALTSGESVRITVSVSRIGWDYVYALPNDFVSPTGIVVGTTRYSMYEDEAQIEFDIFMNDDESASLLFCNIDSNELKALEYTATRSNISKYPRSFVECLVFLLASKLARSLKKDRALAKDMYAHYVDELSNAKAQAQRMSKNEPPTSPGISARFR